MFQRCTVPPIFYKSSQGQLGQKLASGLALNLKRSEMYLTDHRLGDQPVVQVINVRSIRGLVIYRRLYVDGSLSEGDERDIFTNYCFECDLLGPNGVVDKAWERRYYHVSEHRHTRRNWRGKIL